MTLGYVSTEYANRNLTEIFNEIDYFASFGSGLVGSYALNGIFLDNTPSKYTAQNAEYMNQIDNYTREAKGFNADLFVILLFDKAN